MSIHIVDGKSVSDAQWVGWCADDERGLPPKIRPPRKYETEPRPRFRTWEDDYANQVGVPARGPL